MHPRITDNMSGIFVQEILHRRVAIVTGEDTAKVNPLIIL